MSENEKKKEIYEELVNQFEESEVQIISKIQKKKINKLKEEISEMKKIEINRLFCFSKILFVSFGK